jgi:hypothetical protein
MNCGDENDVISILCKVLATNACGAAKLVQMAAPTLGRGSDKLYAQHIGILEVSCHSMRLCEIP